MEIATGLMMVGVALYQEVEAPLGQVGVLNPQGDGEFDQEMAGIIEDIRETYLAFEQIEARRGAEDKPAIQLALKQAAERYESLEEEELE